MKLRADNEFVTMCRSCLIGIIPAYLILAGFVWGCIFLVHLIVR